MPFMVCLVLGIPMSYETSISVPTGSIDTSLLRQGYSTLFWTRFLLLNLTADMFIFVLQRPTETLWTISSFSQKSTWKRG